MQSLCKFKFQEDSVAKTGRRVWRGKRCKPQAARFLERVRKLAGRHIVAADDARSGFGRDGAREAIRNLPNSDSGSAADARKRGPRATPSESTSVVAPHSMDNLGEYLDVHLVLSRSVARSAALRRTSSDLEAIRALERAFQIQTPKDGSEELLRADLSLRQRISDAARNSFLDKFYRLILDYGIRAKVLHYIPNASASELLDAAELASALVDAIEARDEEECDRVVITMLGRERRILSRCLEPRFGDEIRLPPPFAEKSAAA